MLKQYLFLLKHPNLLKYIIYNFYGRGGYFNRLGFTRSYISRAPVDQAGNPTPLATYAYLSFIVPRLTKQMSLLEYGSGHSTLFYSKLVKELYAIEHNETWYQMIRAKLPQHAQIFKVELEYNGEYCRYPSHWDKKFDLIIVDGRDRVNCVYHAINYLTPQGVIILDDSCRENYQPAFDFLLAHGFRKLDFWGIRQTVLNSTCTTIFYRDQNILSI